MTNDKIAKVCQSLLTFAINRVGIFLLGHIHGQLKIGISHVNPFKPIQTFKKIQILKKIFKKSNTFFVPL
jgi:hypothetical protein